jgi:ParB family chromosome partitioning protein
MSETTTVPLGQLHRNDYNPRFAGEADDDIDVSSLADSIRENGLATALTVRPLSKDDYEVIAGERRLLALRELYDDSHGVEVSVHDVDEHDARMLALAENLERKDLTPMQEARAFAEEVNVSEEQTYREYVNTLKAHEPLADLQVPTKQSTDVKELSDRTGRSVTNIHERLSFLLLPQEAQQWIDDGDLTKRAARLIVKRVRNGRQHQLQRTLNLNGCCDNAQSTYRRTGNGEVDSMNRDPKLRVLIKDTPPKCERPGGGICSTYKEIGVGI